MDASGALDFFANAKAKMKWPVLTVHTGGYGFRLGAAPASGKNPGAVYVKGNKSGQYVGMINPKGEWYPAGSWGARHPVRKFRCMRFS